jgi:orotidine-5'-phosphate decarboxylase
MKPPKIIVAIDSNEFIKATSILESLDPNLCLVKIGSVSFSSMGKIFLRLASQKGFRIFLDLKFHDIPNTVYESITSFNDCAIDMLTVHLSGGEQMLVQAKKAAKEINSKVIGVSMLTSLNKDDSVTLFDSSIDNQIKRLFLLAKKINLDGVVCSPHELEMASHILGSNFLKITPGIREKKVNDDQVRIMSAQTAIQKGASFLVIGRPITMASDIGAALKQFNYLIDG